MSTHTVTATITVEITDPTVLAAIPGLHAAGDDERAQVEAAVSAGLNELKTIAGRYGFAVVDAEATVG